MRAALVLVAAAAAFVGAGGAAGATEPSPGPAASIVDCGEIAQPVAGDGPVLDAPQVLRLTVNGEGATTAPGSLVMEGPAQLVVEAAGEVVGPVDIAIDHHGEPFLRLTDIAPGSTCIVDVEFAPGLYQWSAEGYPDAAQFMVPEVEVCTDAPQQPLGDPMAGGQWAIAVVSDGGTRFAVLDDRLVEGYAVLAVRSADTSSQAALVQVTWNGLVDTVAIFVDVPPGSICEVGVELPAGEYTVRTDLSDQAVTFTVERA